MKKVVLFSAQIFLAIPEESSDVTMNTALVNAVEKRLVDFCSKLEGKFTEVNPNLEILLATQHL